MPARRTRCRSTRSIPPRCDSGGEPALFYTVRRLPRRRTEEEKALRRILGLHRHRHVHFLRRSRRHRRRQRGRRTQRAGAVLQPASDRASCRSAQGGADFRLLDDVALEVTCVAGPTPPREPVVSQLRSRSETAHLGTVTWRLINMLSMNHLGLVAARRRQERGSAARRCCRCSPTWRTA